MSLQDEIRNMIRSIIQENATRRLSYLPAEKWTEKMLEISDLIFSAADEALREFKFDSSKQGYNGKGIMLSITPPRELENSGEELIVFQFSSDSLKITSTHKKLNHTWERHEVTGEVLSGSVKEFVNWAINKFTDSSEDYIYRYF
jgi:hypothetical protein